MLARKAEFVEWRIIMYIHHAWKFGARENLVHVVESYENGLGCNS